MTEHGGGRGRSARRGLRVGLGLAAILGVLVYYAWAVSPARPVFAAAGSPDAYYNLLVRGFRAGRLSLDLPVNPALLALPDPYDPRQNAPYRVLDTSLYRGRYYLYFGVVPAVVLYGPFNLLTGRYLSDPQAGLIFCMVGFMAGAALLAAVRRRYFPGLGPVGWFAGVLAWGGLTLVPLLLRRMAIWEVAIAAGFAFSVVSAWALFHAFHARRSLLWLAGASLAYGLAIGSRPTYAFGAIALLGPVLWCRRAAGRTTGETALAGWPAATAAVGPVALIVAALLGYNALRFGNPLEFGERYQLSGVYESHLRHFSPSYVGYNLRAYFLAPAQWSPYFPFVRVVGLPPAPPRRSPAEFGPAGRIPAGHRGADGQGALGRRFTGRILQQRILDPAAGVAPDQGWGGILLAVEYPAGRTSGHEPLVETGGPGRADLLVVNYLGPRRVSFTVDHWGSGGPTSEPVAVDPNVRQTVLVRFGSFFPPAARPAGVAAHRWNEAATRLEVIVNGRELMGAPMRFYPASAATLALGRNEVGASTCSARFTGKILGWHREEAWSGPPDRPSAWSSVIPGSN